MCRGAALAAADAIFFSTNLFQHFRFYALRTPAEGFASGRFLERTPTGHLVGYEFLKNHCNPTMRRAAAQAQGLGTYRAITEDFLSP